jgi:hypothetical protein
LNILIVTQYFHPKPFRISDLALALHGKRSQGDCINRNAELPGGPLLPRLRVVHPGKEDYSGISVVRVPLITRGAAKNWRLILNYLSFAVCACVLGPLRCRQKFEIVLVYEPSPITVGLPGMLMGELKGAPVMLWIQDLWPETLAAVGQHGFLSHAQR